MQQDSRAKTSDYRQDYQNFFKHFDTLLFEVEKAKVTICSTITDWSIEGQLSRNVGYQIKVPSNPISEKSDYVPIRLDATELRQLFIEKLWQKKLFPAITNALARSQGELDALPISVILLSGGSSNIRWLHQLLREAHHRDLANAELLELQENFQEIVAKGLAIECARKTFNKGDGDFRAVTYNRLCLALNPDDRGVEVPRFRAIDGCLPDGGGDGVLLPSASLLETLIDTPIAWKARLSHPPKQKLDYFFMASSFDPDDTMNVHNVVDHTVFRQSSNSFDKNLIVTLQVAKDGTTYPRFIYRSAGPEIPEISIEGRPFFIDMTFGGAAGVAEAYVGVDFGTANSSVSYVDQGSITVYSERSKNATWQNISDLASSLPYPIAAPLVRYLSGTTDTSLDLKAIEVIEGYLSFGAYIAYADHCANRGRNQTKLFKEFSQRSAGPLWALLRKSLEQTRGKSEFSAPFRKLLDEPLRTEIDNLVTSVGEAKHGKLSVGLDYNRYIRLFGNIFSEFHSEYLFGYFQDVQKKPFRSEYKGVFRHAVGGYNSFLRLYEYEGSLPFSEDLAVLVSRQSGLVLSLSPLMFWYQIGETGSYPELYLYDLQNKSGYTYKPIGTNGSLLLDLVGFGPVIEELDQFRQDDRATSCENQVTLTPVMD